jgi:hypothetical protein
MHEKPLPDRRTLVRHEAHIQGHKFFLDCGHYPDGSLGEIFIVGSKVGDSFTRGVLDALARVSSIALQGGVSVERLTRVMQGHNFPPNGDVRGSPAVTQATSVVDWVSQVLHQVYCSGTQLSPPELEGKSFGYVAEGWRAGV